MRWSLAAVLAVSISCAGAKPTSNAGNERAPVTASGPVDWSASGIDWSKPPGPGPERVFAVPAPSRFRLDNGLSVLVIENRRLPLVAAQLIVQGAGSSSDPSGQQGLASLTADLLDEGIGARSALQLARELERLGAYLSSAAETDAIVISLAGLAETLPQSLALMAQLVAPRSAWNDFARVKADRSSALLRRRDRARSVASLVLDRVLFGGHRYSHPSAGYTASLSALSEADVRAFFEAHIGPARATLVIAGDVDAKRLRPVLEREFSAWSAATEPLAEGDPLPRAARPGLLVVDKPGAAQAELRIGRVLMNRADPRYVASRVATSVLGGGFTSRLNRRLREELGYTYGASSRMWVGRHSGTWYARSALQTSNTIAGIKETLRLIEEMRRQDVPAAELERAKQSLIRALPRQFQTSEAVASAYATLVTEAIDPAWYQGYRAQVAAVTVAQVRKRAASSWSRDQLVVVVVGDLAVLLDGLRRLGLGPVIEVDPEGAILRTHTALEPRTTAPTRPAAPRSP